MIPIRQFTVGDRLTSILADLYYADGSPVILGITETVLFRMISRAGVVKINNNGAQIVTRGDAQTGTPARVRYDWASADVDTPGSYVGWFIRVSGGETDHFPTQDKESPQFRIIFRSDS
jgi:hypothetical protein